MMNQDDPISVLETLIETCRDGEKGYKDAAEHVKRPDLKAFFAEQSVERGRFARELEAELARLGKPGKKESGSVAGAMHRAWIDTKANLGGGDHTILESVEQGEDSAKEAYEKALNASLPSEVQMIVRRQAEGIRRAHDKVKSMRDTLAA
ncbi:MAG: hypothetical protein DMG74_13545 [Acidobacteria bacterium]|nr:MAG: hypothetical protein DMG74_13545 [Acidobacteriota bacterium]